MAFKMPHVAVIGGIVAAGIALIFQIIAVAATGWLTSKSSGWNYGLWKACSSSQCFTYSAEIDFDWLQATRAFGLIGLIFIAGALVIGILILFIDKNFLPFAAGGAAGTAAICVMISFAIFADKKQSEYGDSKLSYCFALTVVAFVLCIASGICFIISKRLKSSST